MKLNGGTQPGPVRLAYTEATETHNQLLARAEVREESNPERLPVQPAETLYRMAPRTTTPKSAFLPSGYRGGGTLNRLQAPERESLI